jgi:hypothetical protein
MLLDVELIMELVPVASIKFSLMRLLLIRPTKEELIGVLNDLF